MAMKTTWNILRRIMSVLARLFSPSCRNDYNDYSINDIKAYGWFILQIMGTLG